MRNGFDAAGTGCRGADITAGAGEAAAAVAAACIGDGVITGMATAAGDICAVGATIDMPTAAGGGAGAGADQSIEPKGSVLETCLARPVSALRRSPIKSGAGAGAGASTAKGS